MTGNKVCALCGADFHSTVECPWRLMRPAPVALPEWLQDPESFRDRLHEAGYRGDADAQGTGAEAMRLEILAATPQPPVQQAEPTLFGMKVVQDDTLQPNELKLVYPKQAEPAPAQDDYAPGIAEQLERADWTPEDALRWYAEGKHFDTVNGRTRIIDTGAVASNALKHLSLPYLEMKGDAELSELREQLAAPVQDEREAFEAKFPMPAHCIRCGDSYAATEFHAWGAQEYSKIRQGWLAALEWQATRPAQTEQQPVAWRYKCRDSDAVHVSSVQWTSQSWPADWDETPLYAAPIAQTAPSQPEQSDVQRLREALEKIAKISGDSIHYHPSYMSRIARSALDPKGFDPVEASMRSALSAHRAQQSTQSATGDSHD